MKAEQYIINPQGMIAKPSFSEVGFSASAGRGPRITPSLTDVGRHNGDGRKGLAILSTIAADIFELADAKWLVAAKNAAGRMTPVCIFGRPPALSETLEQAEGVVRGGGEPGMGSAADALLRPVTARGAAIGAIILGPKRGGGEYSSEARELIALASDHIGHFLESPMFASLVSGRLWAMERTRSEIAAAQHIQSRLLPSHHARIEGLECHGQSWPAGEVGGDFFDFIPLGAGELGVAIGDVAGKGIPAAIVMAGLQMSLRALARDCRGAVPRQMAQLNALLFDVLPPESYATLYYASVDPLMRRLTYVNAGHEPPLLIRKTTRTIERLDAGGPVLGLLGCAGYRSGTVALDPGDVLICFTDGVAETCDAGGTEMTVAGIARVALEHLNQPAHEIVDAILKASEHFSQGRAGRDDRTVVVLRIADPSAGATRTARRMAVEPDLQKRAAAACRPELSAAAVVRGSLEMIS